MMTDVLEQVAQDSSQDLSAEALALGLVTEEDIEFGRSVVDIAGFCVADQADPLAFVLHGERVVAIAVNKDFSDSRSVVVEPPPSYARLAKNLGQGGNIGNHYRTDREAFSVDLGTDHGSHISLSHCIQHPGPPNARQPLT